MAALLARMEEHAIASQLQHLPAPSHSSTVPPTTTTTAGTEPTPMVTDAAASASKLLELDTMLADSQFAASTLHRETQRLVQNCELATRRLDVRR